MGDWKGHMDSDSGRQAAACHIAVLHLRRLLAKQAEAYLAVISRSTVEDKNQAWALFSPQPSGVTGLLYSAWNLWDDHLWWPGCPSLAVMFSMVMMFPLCLRPQNRHPPRDSISPLKVIVDGSIKGWKNVFFSLPRPLSHPLRWFIFARQPSLFMSSSPAPGCIRFELVALMGWFETTLIQLLHAGDVMAQRDCTGNQKLWPGTVHADSRLWLPGN